MQYLKDDVRDKILSSALREFKDKGYIDSSMRRIAQSANIVSGNIYRYFTNKEALFEALMQPVYERLMKYISDIENESKNDYRTDSLDPLEYIHKIDNLLNVLFKEYSTELKILLNKSRGSKYENVKEDLKVFVDRLLKENYIRRDRGSDQPIAYVLASTIVEGMCIILERHDDGEEIKALMDKFIAIYALGINDSLRQPS